MNDPGVEEQPAVLRAFGKRARDDGPGLGRAAVRGQRPSLCVERKDIRAHAELGLGERQRGWRVLAASGEVERDRARIAGRAARDELALDGRGVSRAARRPQRVGEDRLILGQRVEIRRVREHSQCLRSLPLCQEDATSGEKRRGIVGFEGQRRVCGAAGVGGAIRLQLVKRHARPGPRGRFRIARAGRFDGAAHGAERAVEVALHPARVSGARIGLIEGLQIDHPLIGGHGLGEPSLLHQRVAEQAVVEHDRPPGDELTRNLLRLLESVQLVQDVTAQQQRGRVAGYEACRQSATASASL